MAAPPSTSSTTTTESPVLSVIDKRLRALRKKKNRIVQMEESVSQGKTLNKEQLEVLQSKPSVIAIIDELEKLRSPLATALDEELSKTMPLSSSEKVEVNDGDKDEVVVKDLLNLMYFGSLFDVKEQSEFASLMFTRSHERSSCLTYDYVTDDATDVLGERDLDLISALQGLMISRPVDTAVSHKDALERCIHHAKLWLSNSEVLIDSQSNVTYAGLREKLEKIMASDFFTTIPEMKRPGEVAAAGVGSFGSFQVSMDETTVVPVEVPVQIERSVEQHNPETEVHVANHEEYETGEHQTGSTEEHQDDVEAENPSDVVQTEQDQEHFQAEEEHGYRNSDFKDQQYVPRRGSRGGRGGGGGGGRRGGYFNGRGGRGGGGRGGGPYQNGRSHQYYDNYHQPRNYYNKRGGRGGSGGGNSYYNHPSSAQGNHAQANMGVAS